MKKTSKTLTHTLVSLIALTAVAEDQIDIQIDNTYIHDVHYTEKIVFLSNLDATSVANEAQTSHKGKISMATYSFYESSEIELTNFYDSETGLPCVILTGQGVIKAYTSYQSLINPDKYIKGHLNLIITGDQATGCRIYQVI